MPLPDAKFVTDAAIPDCWKVWIVQKAANQTLFAIHNSFESRVKWTLLKSYQICELHRVQFVFLVQKSYELYRNMICIVWIVSECELHRVQFVSWIQKSYELQTAFNLKVFPRFILFSNLGCLPDEVIDQQSVKIFGLKQWFEGNRKFPGTRKDSVYTVR